MSVKIKGTNELIVALEEKIGKEKMEEVTKQAVKEGAEFLKNEINTSIAYRVSKKWAKGWTVADTTISKIEVSEGVVKAEIHWKGSHGRYRIIHLNEWGTVKNPNPPRKGAIAAALKTGIKPYRGIIAKRLRGGM